MLNRHGEYWIGLHQFEMGTFGWADNSPVTFTYWNRNEPNGGENVSDTDKKTEKNKRETECEARKEGHNIEPWNCYRFKLLRNTIFL